MRRTTPASITAGATTSRAAVGIPFRKGVDGKGGMANDFDMGDHGLRALRVENYHGILFGTFAETPSRSRTTSAPPMAWHLKRA